MQWLKQLLQLNYSPKVKHSGVAGEKPGRLEADRLKDIPRNNESTFKSQKRLLGGLLAAGNAERRNRTSISLIQKDNRNLPHPVARSWCCKTSVF